MDLEKGAWRFYHHLLDRFAGRPIAEPLEKLAAAETAHARMVYRYLQQLAPAPLEPFDTLFKSLSGNILEGGDEVADALQWVDTREQNPCLEVIELALRIEYAAYDLYRSVADRIEEQAARDSLLSIAQAEKAHMRSLSRAIGLCPQE
jgi:rubrerythrin